ncbi:peptidoglycan editing factor PgeF [Candidatus Gottesmanbacteria bacterium]|nr:peptidoglycan editing factor PgeF [Candidatus Gottesmanbacteria bacterium]
MVRSKILSKYPNLLHFFGDKNSTFPLENIITAEQIHSDKVAIIKDDKAKFIKGYDGLVTNKPLLLGIRTADCLPIFFFDPKKKVTAAIHAGWKGLYEGIIINALNKMIKLGSSPMNLKVAVGPHIQVCCYRVSRKRFLKFQKLLSIQHTPSRSRFATPGRWPNGLLPGESRKKSSTFWYLNLSRIASLQLESLGILPDNIEISKVCTSCDNKYWSFRRDGKIAGRMINIIGNIEQTYAIDNTLK